MAAAGGVLVALVLMYVAQYPVLGSFVAGLAVFAALGLVLGWSFCGRAEQVTAVPVTHAKPEAEKNVQEDAPVEPRRITGDLRVLGRGVSAASTGLDAALAKSKERVPDASPERLAAPRNGRADDLQLIKGVGPAIEEQLNEIGIWHFDQIASWKARDIAFVDSLMVGFHGRITRDEWVKQAKILARGGQTEFSERAPSAARSE
ncbi:hypothetical protein OEZ60_03820 [Defluviimonas sp. WL0024]|uniref:NADH-quinone oxidoreductase subunit E n=1 Tax=Albidovulum salinarum TaxID=2984153 RepID=A0ABT2WZL7_9RHOB|nr:hypothetical protein [Defluviimonas sp. WL0024]MCU9847125.1 hypothetical protein [Defluviimonas sp. WL0024]